MIKAALAKGKTMEAIKIAAKFKTPDPIVAKAWAAYRNPSFYKQLGQDVDGLIEQAKQIVATI